MLAALTTWMDVQAYDQHLNMILGEVEEVVTTVEIDDETYEEIVRVRITYSAFSSCVGYIRHASYPCEILLL